MKKCIKDPFDSTLYPPPELLAICWVKSFQSRDIKKDKPDSRTERIVFSKAVTDLLDRNDRNTTWIFGLNTHCRLSSFRISDLSLYLGKISLITFIYFLSCKTEKTTFQSQ